MLDASTVSERSRTTELRSITEPDILSKEQYWGLTREKHLMPEKALMFYALQDAIENYQKYCGAKSLIKAKLFSETEYWIFSDRRRHLYSFVIVCEFLNLDPNYIRKGLLAWKANRRKK